MRNLLVPEIYLFSRIVDLGTFTAVAEEMDSTPSGVSRTLIRLEERLGTKLLHRSTRKLTLTTEGELFLAHAKKFLLLADDVEVDLSAALGKVQGHLRIDCGTAFAKHKLTPALPRFLKMYSDVTLAISVNDSRIDPVKDQVDVTIRVGELDDSDLVAVRLGTVKRIIAASPAYLKNRGTPTTIADLADHSCLLLSGFSEQAVWPMIQNDEVINVKVDGTVVSDSADILLNMAIEGVGIIRLGDFLGEEALANGQLQELFAQKHDPEPKPLSALISPNRQHIPRVRAFIDYLKNVV